MRFFHGLKLGGLQQKIFNLMLVIILALVGAYVAVSVVSRNNLSEIVKKSNEEQQKSIAQVSDETMEAVLALSMTKTTALQSYIADDLFGDVKTSVLTLHSFANELFNNASSFSDHAYYAPDKNDEGVPSVRMLHESGVDPEESETLGLVANMSEIMLSMFTNSARLDSCFVATADGCLLFANDRVNAYFDEEGNVYDLEIRQRPWYVQAVAAGELIFTGVETDAFTNIKGVVCAAPVYHDGELVAVVGADAFLTAVNDYVMTTAANGGFACVIGGDGKVLFSPRTDGVFKAELASDAIDLRESDNATLANFITEALEKTTGLVSLSVDGKDYYATGTPLSNVGWTVVSLIDKEVTNQPTSAMLARYDEINADALSDYQEGSKHSETTFFVLTGVVLVLATIGSLLLVGKVVKPLEYMTRRINSLTGEDSTFVMEKIYKTNDEIEVLAQSFAELSERTNEYIKQITSITAEKERIGTELALATRIQANMLPSTYPAFPDRSEFDIYAKMDPAREVGGDFYDYFLIDEDHLCLLIADVSGKGVPAALFMMASRIILASNAKLGKSPAEILTLTNETICRNNKEEMFVTVWLGILEISTGKLTAANAGHSYPVIMKTGGKFEILKDKHGFVIGGMAGVKYTEYEVDLTPDSRVFLYTDGVSEATNSENELFGMDRMLSALNKNPNASPEEMLENVRKAVDEFVGDAEQFDDLTMLGLEYKGVKNERS